MDGNEKLKRVFREIFDLPEQTDFEALRYRGIQQWDSVAHMQLVAALESAFDIMLDTEDVIDLSSFPRAKDILKKYDVSFESRS
jgi:acyl carrier protein